MCMCVCLRVCVRACLIERYTKKKKHPTFEWEVVICGELPKTKKNEAIFCCERDAA